MELKQEVKDICVQIRKDIINMVYDAGSGHPGGSLSGVEIMAALYFTDLFRCDTMNPDWKERDRFVLSKGHASPLIYSVLCRKGFFREEELKTFRKMGTILQGHPHRQQVPGLDSSGGSLGQGLSIANGMAMGYRMQGIEGRCYCLLGDGELQEGQVWEAAMTAAQQKLDHVCAIVDNNHVQLDGMTADVCCVEPVADKWRYFGWNVITVDGHDLDALYAAYRSAGETKGRPTVLVAETIKGKGVSFMEGQAGWHGAVPNEAQYKQAMTEIEGGGKVG
ncbi:MULTISPECIES: transketolase [Clostridia]|uniref:Transketolase n=1 Tax=Enterocloster citroniae TaxID=358743 RepID=A0AA41K4A7_9FIRM|nr:MULTISPECIES: transketolase [Clostridia]MBT9808330.1 transketolase [Enterocloster citroniae]RGC09088.1 transketolase [Enterocloster citroniae]